MRTRRKKRNRKALRRRRSAWRFSVWAGVVSLSFAIALLAGGYLMQVSATASKGFAIRTLQREINSLKMEGEQLEFQIAKDRSMVAVQEKVAALGMVPESDIEYIASTEPVVARR